MPSIFHVEIHEGADVKYFFDGLGSRKLVSEMLRLENVTVALSPRRVVDLSDDEVGLRRIGLTKAVVEGNRVEYKAEMAKLRQQPDRSRKGLTGLLLNFTLDALSERFGRIAKMVSTMKTKRRWTAY